MKHRGRRQMEDQNGLIHLGGCVKAPASAQTRGNEKLADIYYQKVMNQAKIDAIPKILGDDFTFTIPTHPEVFRGIQGFTEEVTGLHGAFPDVHLNVHHRWVFEDLILGLWTGTGTHIGEKPLSTAAGPLPATGRAFTIEGVSWINADGTQLRENLANEDTLRIIHDLGVKDCSNIYNNAASALVLPAQFPKTNKSNRINKNLFAENAILNHPLLTEEAKGKEQIGSFFKTYWSSFENVEMKVTQAKRSKDVNAFRWVFNAEHTGEFFGIPATHKRISHQGVSINILGDEGKIDKMYVNENLIVLIGQMQSSN